MRDAVIVPEKDTRVALLRHANTYLRCPKLERKGWRDETNKKYKCRKINKELTKQKRCMCIFLFVNKVCERMTGALN